MDSFEIPPEFKATIRHVELQDTRSDDEILDSLCQYAPVTSEKNIWGFWDAGTRAMPKWCQRNVIDWVRICGNKGWTVRILESNPDSPNHPTKFVDAELLPGCFREGTMRGKWTGPHSADFIRGACLWTHGGVSIDVGIILIRDLDRICWDKLVEPGSPYGIASTHLWGQTISNFFLAARKGNPFIKRWHELFTHVWSGRSTHDKISQDPLIKTAADTVAGDNKTNGIWDINVPYETWMDYISQLVCWQQLCMLEDSGDGFSGVDYWMNNVYVIDSTRECMGGDTMVGFDGWRLFDLMTMKRDAPTTENVVELPSANDLTWDLLSNACMLKVVRGTALTDKETLGAILDRPEYEEKTYEQGTYFELLRYGSVRFRQTREDIRLVKQWRPPVTMKRRLLGA